MKLKRLSSFFDRYEKDSNSEGVRRVLISAQSTCPRFNLPFSPGRENHHSSLILLYIFIYLLYKIWLLLFENGNKRGKTPKSFEEWGLLMSSEESASEKRQVSGVCQVSQRPYPRPCLRPCLRPIVLLSLIPNRMLRADLVTSVLLRRVERRRRGEGGGGVLTSVNGAVSLRHLVILTRSSLHPTPLRSGPVQSRQEFHSDSQQIRR